MDAFHKKENQFTLSFQTEFELFKDLNNYNELNRILMAFALTIGSGLMFFLNCWADRLTSTKYKQFDNEVSNDTDLMFDDLIEW